MLFITYQPDDYYNYKQKYNDEFCDLKKALGIPSGKNIYWCVPANNIYQALFNSFVTSANRPFNFIMFETDNYYKIDKLKWEKMVAVQDISNMVENVLNVEYDCFAEYIVTDIPIDNFTFGITNIEDEIEYYQEIYDVKNKTLKELYKHIYDEEKANNTFQKYGYAELPNNQKNTIKYLSYIKHHLIEDDDETYYNWAHDIQFMEVLAGSYAKGKDAQESYTFQWAQCCKSAFEIFLIKFVYELGRHYLTDRYIINKDIYKMINNYYQLDMYGLEPIKRIMGLYGDLIKEIRDETISIGDAYIKYIELHKELYKTFFVKDRNRCRITNEKIIKLMSEGME